MDETPAQQPGPTAPGQTPPGATQPGYGQPGYTQPGYGQPGPDQGGYTAPPTGTDAFFDNVRRMGVVRSDERWVGGVAGGLALRLGIDPLILRGLFGIGALLGGIGLVLYGIGWLLLPEQRDGRIHIQQLFRGDFDAAVIGGFAAILIGFGATDAWGMPWWGSRGDGRWGGLVAIVAIVTIIVVIASNASRSRGTGPSTSLPRTPPPYGPAPYGPAPFGPAPFGPAPFGPTPGPAQRPPQGPTQGPYAPPPPRPTAYGPATPAAAHRPSEGTSMPAAPPAAPAPQAHGPGQPGYAHGGSGYGQGYGPGYGQPPYAMHRPPVPTGPRTSLPPQRSGPGGRPVGIVVALSLLVLAGLLYAERIDRFDHPVLLTTAAVMVILSGLGIAIAGALGRTSGGLGGLAIVTLLIAVPIGAASDVNWSSSHLVGDAVYRPTDVAAAEDGYDVLAGTVTIDLTDLPLDGDVVTVPVRLGAGELTVILPEDGAYTARVRQSAGDFTWLDDPTTTGVGDGGWRTYSSDAVDGGAAPEIELELSLMAGELNVEEGR